ncbi:hypothetical protein WDU94_012670 [Cyamophila willieti]
MSEDLNLISTCVFQGREYVLSLKLVASHTLDVNVTDKFSGEVWAGSYDCTYIENITHKTNTIANFITRSNLDRIHYPLPLDYCGPPNPLLLQATIRKLEAEVTRLRDMLDKRNSAVLEDSSQTMSIRGLENKIKELITENNLLVQNIEQLSKKQGRNSGQTEMKRTLRILEEQVEQERYSFQLQMKELKNENQQLLMQLEECQKSESLLQEQLKLVQARVQSKPSVINNVNKRTRIRRNKYQLPPLPERHHSNMRGSSPRTQMMGDGVNIRCETLLTKKHSPGTLSLPSSRRRRSSESSLTSCRSRSSSVESRNRKRERKLGEGRKTREEKKRRSSGGIKGKESPPVSIKTSGKSSKPSSTTRSTRVKNSIHSERSCHSSSESVHSQYSATSSNMRKRKTSRKKLVNTSNESKKSSSEIENRIKTLQKMLKESVHL